MSAGISPEHAQELAQCYTLHAKRLFNYGVYLSSGDRALAEDLVDETFVAAAGNWCALSTYSDAQRYTWLRSVLQKKAFSIFRHNGVERSIRHQVEERYRPAEADTHRDALFSIALERLRQAMGHLTEMQRLVVSMHLGDGMKPNEIAANLGISVSTVYVHLHDARRRLKAKMGPGYPFDEDALREERDHD